MNEHDTVPEHRPQTPLVAPLECLVVDRQQAAGMLGISERTLYELVKKGEVHTARIAGRVFFSTEHLRQYVASRVGPDDSAVRAARNNNKVRTPRKEVRR